MKIPKGLVYDYEAVLNCFLGVFVNTANPKDFHMFEMSEFHNDFPKFIAFLDMCLQNSVRLVSYNGLKYDSQLTWHCWLNRKKFLTMSGAEIASEIYQFSQNVIALTNAREFPPYNPTKIKFRECDLLAINNYDNAAKRTSLKWLQYMMDWPNVEDMPKPFNERHDERDILWLKKYCLNDCLSTREKFFKDKSEILLRNKLSAHFKLNLFNASEPKLAKEIFLKLLSEEMGVDKKQLRKQRTFREKVHLADAILPYISFKTPKLKQMLSTFKQLVLDGENLKGSFAQKVTYRGLEFSFALGGIHGAKKGIYVSDKNYVIKSFDVTSFYPNLAIRNGWSPAHLPKELFCRIYESFFEERKKYSKKDPLNYVYKILLNSTYGLSNEENSFLKDSLFTMKITCNGQLLLVMLMEDLCESIPGARPVMVNTDGGEVIIPREYEPLYDEICKKWEKLTKLELEFVNYQKIIVPDVNNYIGIMEGKKIKEREELNELLQESPRPLIKRNKKGEFFHYPIKVKGRFEVDKPLHKNKSFRIKRLAYYNYFAHGISPEETLAKNKNIYDYCAGIRAKGNYKLYAQEVEMGEIVKTVQQKTVRYFVATSGVKLTKEGTVFSKKKNKMVYSIIKLQADKCVEQVLNVCDPNIPFEDYNIDTRFYLRTIRKEINNIEPMVQQQTLF